MAVSIYLYSPDIIGSVAAVGYENHMEVDSVSFSANNTDYHPNDSSSASGTSRGNVQMGNFNLTKAMDDSAVSLMNALTKRIPHNELKIKFVRLGGGSTKISTPFLVYTLTNAFITDYSMSAGSGSKAPMESLALTYEKIEMKYIGINPAGRPKGQEVMSYDLRSGTGR